MIDTYFQCLLLCSKNDEDIVNKLKEILSVHVRIKEPGSNSKTSIPKVTVMHIDNFNEALPLLYDISIFIFFSKSFLFHAKYSTCESALQQIYQDQERHCILIPVFKNGKDRSEPGIPAYLCSMESVILDDLLKDCTFETIDERSLSKYSFKKGVIRRFEQMFSKSYDAKDLQNMERIFARQILKNEYANQYCREMTSKADTSKLQNQIILDGRNYSIGNALSSNVIIINNESPKNEVERSDDGCPLYILVDADDEDLKTNEDVEGQLAIKDLKLKTLRTQLSQNLELATNSGGMSLLDRGRVTKVRPIVKVMPFRHSDENREIEQTHPKDFLPGLPSSD